MRLLFNNKILQSKSLIHCFLKLFIRAVKHLAMYFSAYIYIFFIYIHRHTHSYSMHILYIHTLAIYTYHEDIYKINV